MHRSRQIFAFAASYVKYCFAAAIVLMAMSHAGYGQEAVTPGDDSGSASASGTAASGGASTRSASSEETRLPSEIVFTGLGSIGHYHIFANSWWSYVDFAGVEYDRHVWGYKLGARADYSASFQPMVLLWQPKTTDVWGNPLPLHSKLHTLNYGIGIQPIGLRLTWRSQKNFKPYFLAQGGMVIFDKKAVSQYAAYQNFSLQFSVGAQFKIAPRWDARVGFSDFHFSDAFMVPSNPGLDSMAYTCGLSYRLKDRSH